MDESITHTSKDTESKSKTLPLTCTICNAPASYKYFGAIACHACKIFFKRNAETGLNTFHCNLNGNCEINITNRHICTFCRLTKCFASGMQIEMIRCSRKGNKKKSHSIKSITTNEQNQSHCIQISNQFDHSELNIDQRNLLLNLNHCYEEHNIILNVQQFIQEQINLPIKLRYKVASLDILFGSILNGIELLFKLNKDFSLLYSHNYSSLLRYAMENAGNFTIALILREIPLFNYSDNFEFISLNLKKHLPNEIIRDGTFIQLGITMFIFSTTNSTGYSDKNSNYLTHIKDILRIQDFYAEITWKYLLYKYDHKQAVIYFIHLIKFLIIIDTTIFDIHQSEQHKRIIENLIVKINQQIIVSR